MSWIQTVSDRKVDLINPAPDSIDIRDIAHSLARQCRFNGHTRVFYSVAQHSVLAARRVDAEFAGSGLERAEMQMLGLLHDAAEAYVGDLVKPLKGLLPKYETLEERVQEAILTRFGLPTECSHSLPPLIKAIDLRLLMTERRDLMGPAPERWALEVDPYAFNITPLPTCELAEAVFLSTFDALEMERLRYAVGAG